MGPESSLEYPGDVKETFGQHVRDQRKKLRLPIRVLAERIGVSTSYLSRVERGEYAPPSEETINLLASELSDDPVYLLALAGKLPKSISQTAQENPDAIAAFIRTIRTMNEEELMFWAAMWRIMEVDDPDSEHQTDGMVSLALSRIYDRLGVSDDPAWIEEFKKLVPTLSDLKNRASALAELQSRTHPK